MTFQIKPIYYNKNNHFFVYIHNQRKRKLNNIYKIYLNIVQAN